MDKHPTAFISYSWDNKEHKQWVRDLAYRLRKNGVDATLDQFEVQIKTVNLNQMMVSAFRDYDYVIIVLTEKYAVKAEKGEGGVGFETLLSYSLLRENKDKLVFITRGDFNKVFPSYLKGFYAIDFTNEEQYNDNFEELLRRIYRKPQFEKTPLGTIPEFILSNNHNEFKPNFEGIDIPNLREITDIDKIKFMEKNFNEITVKLKNLLERTRIKNSNFDFTHEKVTSRKEIFRLFKNGRYVTGLKIWLGDFFGSTIDNICLSYGRITNNDNTMNEQLRSVISDDNELKLKFTLNPFISERDKALNTDEVVKAIWDNYIYNSIKSI